MREPQPLTFSISRVGAFCGAAPYLLRHQAMPKIAGILMFPPMLPGPSLSAIASTTLAGKGRASRVSRGCAPRAVLWSR
jgi:hypothetical protein